MERARLIIEDQKQGKKSAHKTWWECTEQEFISPDPSIKVRVTDHEKEEQDWYSAERDHDSYFCYTNTNRRVMKKGE